MRSIVRIGRIFNASFSVQAPFGTFHQNLSNVAAMENVDKCVKPEICGLCECELGVMVESKECRRDSGVDGTPLPLPLTPLPPPSTTIIPDV